MFLLKYILCEILKSVPECATGHSHFSIAIYCIKIFIHYLLLKGWGNKNRGNFYRGENTGENHH